MGAELLHHYEVVFDEQVDGVAVVLYVVLCFDDCPGKCGTVMRDTNVGTYFD